MVDPHPIYPSFQNKTNQSINHTPPQKIKEKEKKKYGTLDN